MEPEKVKDRVKKIMDTKGVTVAQLARDTKIPSARIYKWYKDGLHPKSPDEKILEKWIEEIEEVPRETENIEGIESVEKSIFGLVDDRLRALAVIERLTAVLESREARMRQSKKGELPDEGEDGTVTTMPDRAKKKAGLK